MSDPNTPQTPTIVDDISTEPSGLTEVQQETKALIDAIRKKAQAEAQSAGEFTRESYLNAVRTIRESIEESKLFEPEKIEESITEVKKEAEKNWQAIVQEVQDFGDRLSEAAKTAWEILMPEDKTPKE